jgi:hypothetical protein
MISFLTSPKPFRDLSKDIQYRAIRNWLTVADGAEVILYGDSPGIDEAAAELGVRVQKEVGCAPSGLPYFGAIAAHAAEHARYDLQVYLNCDILLSGLYQVMERLKYDRYLLIGQCINLGEGVVIDEPADEWISILGNLAAEKKLEMRSVAGVDYFGFRRGTWDELPPVVIGRGAYDQALLSYCQRRGFPLVDATLAVTALHQFHEYGHVAGGQKTVFSGEDAKNNLIVAGRHSVSVISDAEYFIDGSTIRYQPCRGDWLRRLELIVRYKLGWNNPSLTLRLAWRMLNPLGFSRAEERELAHVIEALSKVNG